MQNKNSLSIKHKELDLRLEVSPDLIDLHLSCDATGFADPAPVTENELMNLLVANSFSQNQVIEQALKDVVKLINNKQAVPYKLIAKGHRPPPPVLNGKTVVLVKPYTVEKVKSPERLDRNQIRHFDDIEIGDCVARVYKEKEPVQGRDVYGKAVASAAPKPATGAKLGFNPDSIELVEPNEQHPEYAELIAKKGGYAVIERSTIFIHDEFVVEGDVDVKSGNISFAGNIKINGNVARDTTVIAGGNIVVSGDVQGTLFSAEGDITVGGVILGDIKNIRTSNMVSTETLEQAKDYQNQIQIVARKNVTAKRMENVSIETYGDVIATNELRNCKINTAGKVITQGIVYAGTIYTVQGVDARRLGLPSEVTTEIVFCNLVNFSRGYMKLIEEMEENAEELATLKVNLDKYINCLEELAKASPESKKSVIAKLQRYQALSAAQKALKAKHQQILQEAKDKDPGEPTKVHFTDKLYPGVTIKSGSYTFSTLHIMDGPKTIRLLEGKEEFSIFEH